MKSREKPFHFQCQLCLADIRCKSWAAVTTALRRHREKAHPNLRGRLQYKVIRTFTRQQLKLV